MTSWFRNAWRWTAERWSDWRERAVDSVLAGDSVPEQQRTDDAVAEIRSMKSVGGPMTDEELGAEIERMKTWGGDIPMLPRVVVALQKRWGAAVQVCNGMVAEKDRLQKLVGELERRTIDLENAQDDATEAENKRVTQAVHEYVQKINQQTEQLESQGKIITNLTFERDAFAKQLADERKDRMGFQQQIRDLNTRLNKPTKKKPRKKGKARK
jgi:hypothetical protein